MKRKLISLLVSSTVIGMTSPVFAGLSDIDEAIQNGDFQRTKHLVLDTVNDIIAKDEKVNPHSKNLFVDRVGNHATVILSSYRTISCNEPSKSTINYRKVCENKYGCWDIDASITEGDTDQNKTTTIFAYIYMDSEALSEFGKEYFRRAQNELNQSTSSSRYSIEAPRHVGVTTWMTTPTAPETGEIQGWESDETASANTTLSSMTKKATESTETPEWNHPESISSSRYSIEAPSGLTYGGVTTWMTPPEREIQGWSDEPVSTVYWTTMKAPERVEMPDWISDELINANTIARTIIKHAGS